ncbi:hypothetical protein UlMin_030604 [Ulmus minor]
MLIRIAHWKNLQLFFECVCLDFFGLKLSIRCVCFTFLFLFFNISLPPLSVYLYLFDEILISFLVYLDILHIFHLKRALEMKSYVGCSYSNLFLYYTIIETIMFYPQHYLVGLDISDKAIHTTIKLSSSQPNASYFMCLKADFFTWHPTDLFDFIFDYTFFCAIEPEMRSVWAQEMRDILKPDGELMMLMFK